MTASPFIDDLANSHTIQWLKYVNHPFVKALAEGSLPSEAYLRYTAQGSLYLQYYAKAQAMAIIKSRTFGEMAYFAQCVLATSQSVQGNLQVLKDAGMDAAAVGLIPETDVTTRYGEFLLHAGQPDGSTALEVLVATAPCLFGYGEIGNRVMAVLDRNTETDEALWVEPKPIANPYWRFVEFFVGDAYQKQIQVAAELIQKLLEEEKPDTDRIKRLQTLWLEALAWEIAFFDEFM